MNVHSGHLKDLSWKLKVVSDQENENTNIISGNVPPMQKKVQQSLSNNNFTNIKQQRKK